MRMINWTYILTNAKSTITRCTFGWKYLGRHFTDSFSRMVHLSNDDSPFIYRINSNWTKPYNHALLIVCHVEQNLVLTNKKGQYNGQKRMLRSFFNDRGIT